MVIGGWAPDTRRELIIQEATRIVETMQVLDEVKDTIVFGKRSSTCHVLLKDLPEQAARERVFSWQKQHGDKHILPSSGKPAWFTAHKSQQGRFKNRITRRMLDCLEGPLGIEARTRIDCDWARQIIWLDDQRVATARPEDLGCESGTPSITHSIYNERQKEEITTHFHGPRLAACTGKTLEELQQLLAPKGAQE